MQQSITTERLSIDLITTADHDFMLELLNSKGWIEFIGDRNIHSKEDAIAFIKKILGNPLFVYRVVKLKNENVPIGIISFIKRDYLIHHDVGFAFLPGFTGNGYAYEASKEVLEIELQKPEHSKILATTQPKNLNSIKLLNKLGLHFDEVLHVENQILHVYSITNKLSI